MGAIFSRSKSRLVWDDWRVVVAVFRSFFKREEGKGDEEEESSEGGEEADTSAGGGLVVVDLEVALSSMVSSAQRPKGPLPKSSGLLLA